MAASNSVLLGPSISAEVRAFAEQYGMAPETIAEEAVSEGLAMLREKLFFDERSKGADTAKAIAILRRAGNEAPGPDDQLPQDYRRRA